MRIQATLIFWSQFEFSLRDARTHRAEFRGMRARDRTTSNTISTDSLDFQLKFSFVRSFVISGD